MIPLLPAGKNAMKRLLPALLFFLAVKMMQAQTYSSSCGLNISIPDNSCLGVPLIYPISVGGVAGSQMGVD
ncbi:MAG TPA: hypothetical protein VNJ07_05570, partial [Chitinophagales bacterium]|nr:hypothetical protein [Chitinophagales bacterium]